MIFSCLCISRHMRSTLRVVAASRYDFASILYVCTYIHRYMSLTLRPTAPSWIAVGPESHGKTRVKIRKGRKKSGASPVTESTSDVAARQVVECSASKGSSNCPQHGGAIASEWGGLFSRGTVDVRGKPDRLERFSLQETTTNRTGGGLLQGGGGLCSFFVKWKGRRCPEKIALRPDWTESRFLGRAHLWPIRLRLRRCN